MSQDIDKILKEVERSLEERHFAVFRSRDRGFELRPQVEWDVEAHSDYREFLSTAEAIGVRLMVIHVDALDGAMVEETLEQLQQSDLPAAQRRQFVRELEKLRSYEGFSCSLQLSFDHDGLTYVYELFAPWYSELLDIADAVEAAAEDFAGPPEAPYFSQN